MKKLSIIVQLIIIVALCLPALAFASYTMTTSLTDPSCDTGFGGYVNLSDFGIYPQSDLSGDTVAWTAFASQNPITFFGTTYSGGISFTSDGFAFLSGTPGNTPGTPQSLPDSAEPNTLLAALWHDFEVVYDGTPGAVRGISLATAGPDLLIIEYDGVQLSGTTDIIGDFEIIVNMAAGAKDIVFAYDNLNQGLLTANVFTVGIENEAGDEAHTLINNAVADGVLSDGFMICFDEDEYTLGGSVSGLAAGNSVVLQNSGGDNLTLTTNGDFTFATALRDGSSYTVTVLTQPTAPDQTCLVTGGGSGMISGADMTDVTVSCTNEFSWPIFMPAIFGTDQ